MRALTKNQINLLPQVKENAPKNKKGEILARLIDGYLGGEKLAKGDLDIIKIAVQLHQTNEKKKRLQAKQRQKDYKETKAENAKKTREKIILGACEVVALKNDGRPFLNFLLAVWHGYVSDTDLKFMGERYRIEKGKNREGFCGVLLQDDIHSFFLMDEYHQNVYQRIYKIVERATNATVKKATLRRHDHDPRDSYGN